MDKYSIFFKDQCTVLLNKIIETIYDKLEAFTYIPLAPAEGPGVEYIKWRKFTAVGVAKIISEYATDIPSVEVYGAEEESKVRHLAISYGWNKWELQKAMRAGVSLIDRKDSAARQGIETAVDSIAWFGDKLHKINGFVNYPGITEHTLADSAEGSKKDWASKTPLEISQDITDMVDAILTVTSNKEKPDTCIMPPNLYRMLTTKYVDTNYEVSVLDLIKKSNPMLTTIAPVAALAKAGADGKGRIMVYQNSSDKLEFHLPVPIDQEMEEKRGFRYTTVLTADVGGVTVYYPQSVCYADGAEAAD